MRELRARARESNWLGEQQKWQRMKGRRTQNRACFDRKGGQEDKMERRDQLQKTLLTPAEASALFNVSVRTIYFWYRTGNIKGINVNGKCLRILSKSIREFLRSKTGVDGKESSVGRKRNARADSVPALPAEQGRQMVQRYGGDGQREMSSGGSGPVAGMLTELTQAETEMLRNLVERAGVPGYHDWAGMDLRK
jgi:hypothetical protein